MSVLRPASLHQATPRANFKPEGLPAARPDGIARSASMPSTAAADGGLALARCTNGGRWHAVDRRRLGRLVRRRLAGTTKGKAPVGASPQDRSRRPWPGSVSLATASSMSMLATTKSVRGVFRGRCPHGGSAPSSRSPRGFRVVSRRFVARIRSSGSHRKRGDTLAAADRGSGLRRRPRRDEVAGCRLCHRSLPVARRLARAGLLEVIRCRASKARTIVVRCM